MATDKKIPELTAASTVADADVFPVVENSTSTTKKISWTVMKGVLKTYFDTLYQLTTTTIGTLISGATAKDTPIDADQFGLMDSASGDILKKLSWAKLKTGIFTALKNLSNASIAGTSGTYSTDTYIAGSGITIPTTGGWQAGNFYRLVFVLTKTAAGTEALTVTLRMGTVGDITDAAIAAVSFGAGTAASDIGRFEVLVNFRSVGSGTSAIVRLDVLCSHSLAATGLISTGASGFGAKQVTSSGFNSTTKTTIGVSINGGTSFSGSCSLVLAELINITL